MYSEKTLQRFWSKVAICAHGKACITCCWPWQGHLVKGYGVLSLPKAERRNKNKEVRAGRLCLEIVTGYPLPDELHACHDCPGGDNPACVQPAHLWAGTIDDNQKDSMRKGRRPTGDKHGLRIHPEACHRGEENVAAVLSTEDVYAIREYARLGYSGGQIAQVYPATTAGNIGAIVRRKSWGHLPEKPMVNFVNQLSMAPFHPQGMRVTNKEKTHCPLGHPYTHITPRFRRCRRCTNAQARKRAHGGA